MTGTAGAQLITIAVMPLLSRLYSPAEFGVWAVFLAVSSISATFVTLRYETTILLPKDNQDAFQLAWLSGLLTLGLGVVLIAIAWLLPSSAREYLGIANLGDFLVLAIAVGIFTALLAIGTNWLNRGCAYQAMSWLRFLQSIVLSGAAVLLGVYGISHGLLISQFVAILLVTALMFWLLRGEFIGHSIKRILSLAKTYNHTPKYLLPTALLDTVTLQLPVLLITAWFSSELAGQFSMAWKILALPSALIGAAVGQVFLQKFSHTWPDKVAAKRLLYRTWLILAVVGFVPFALIMGFGEDLFIFALGSQWADAGNIAVIIAPMLYVILISSPTSGTFLVLGLQKNSLYFGLSFLVYRVASIYYGFYTGNILLGLSIWVIIEITAIAVYNLFILRRMKHEINRCY